MLLLGEYQDCLLAEDDWDPLLYLPVGVCIIAFYLFSTFVTLTLGDLGELNMFFSRVIYVLCVLVNTFYVRELDDIDFICVKNLNRLIFI